MLTGEQVANIGSQDMNDEVWLKLAKRVNEVLKRWRRATASSSPTAPTRWRRPATSSTSSSRATSRWCWSARCARPPPISADGPGNLYNAVAVAADPRARRGAACSSSMNDAIHDARNVEKTNTTNVETFASPERGPPGPREQRQDRLVRADGQEAHHQVRVLGRQARQAAARRHHLRARQHERRPHRRGRQERRARASSSPASATAT